MADIELVIKIDEHDIKQIDKIRFLIGGKEDRNLQINIINAIKNGTPLPKGHGRLKDEEEILRELGSYHIGGIDAIKIYNGENTWEDGLHTAWRVIDDAETIIPEESEKNEISN